jgi:hypothetical protein
MSLFGKLLAIFNIFAVVGALALMAMNYAKRQSWQYAVFHQELIEHGLPLNEKDTDEQEEKVQDKIGEKMQQDLFQQVAPSTPVANQEDEVKRVRDILRSQIQNAGDKKKQIYMLAHIVAPMAVTFEERERALAYETYLRDEATFTALKSRLSAADAAATAAQAKGRAKPYEEAFHDAVNAVFSDPPGPLAEAYLAAKKAEPNAHVDKALEQSLDAQLTQLQSQFDQMFADALQGGEGIKGGAPAQRKRAIARLLFNMVEVMPSTAPAGGEVKPDLVNNPAYKRFVIVVGLKAALEAVNERASILQDLTFEAELERQRERGMFAEEHRKVVDLVRDKKIEVNSHKLLAERKKSELETHQAALKKRERDVAFYQEQLTTARAKTAARLQELRKISDTLLRERVQLHKNTLENQDLEKEIRTLEQGR